MKNKLFLVLLIIPLLGFSQSKFGVSSGYVYVYSYNWDRTVLLYNASNNRDLNQISGGINFAVNYKVDLKNKLSLLPELEYISLSSSNKVGQDKQKFSINLLNLNLTTRYSLNEKSEEGKVKNGIIIDISPGLVGIAPKLKVNNSEQNNSEIVVVGYGLSFSVGVGIGYGISLKEKYLLTPFLKYNWFPSSSMNLINSVLLGGEIMKESNEEYLHLLKVGLELRI